MGCSRKVKPINARLEGRKLGLKKNASKIMYRPSPITFNGDHSIESVGIWHTNLDEVHQILKRYRYAEGVEKKEELQDQPQNKKMKMKINAQIIRDEDHDDYHSSTETPYRNPNTAYEGEAEISWSGIDEIMYPIPVSDRSTQESTSNGSNCDDALLMMTADILNGYECGIFSSLLLDDDLDLPKLAD